MTSWLFLALLKGDLRYASIDTVLPCLLSLFHLHVTYIHNSNKGRSDHPSTGATTCTAHDTTMPSIRSQASRSISPSPPRENTALLAPSTPTPAHGFQNQAHLRKASVGGRSVSGRSTAGSIRGYGTVDSRPGPASQAPRVSKLGQRVSPLGFCNIRMLMK